MSAQALPSARTSLPPYSFLTHVCWSFVLVQLVFLLGSSKAWLCFLLKGTAFYLKTLLELKYLLNEKGKKIRTMTRCFDLKQGDRLNCNVLLITKFSLRDKVSDAPRSRYGQELSGQLLGFINMYTEVHTYPHLHAGDVKNKSRNGIESHKRGGGVRTASRHLKFSAGFLSSLVPLPHWRCSLKWK